MNHNNLDEASQGLTHTAGQKAQVLELFKAILTEEPLNAQHSEIEFYRRSFPLEPLDIQLCQEVVWEVYEMEFHLELLTLDKCICPSPQSLFTRQTFEYEHIQLISHVFGNSGNICITTLPVENCGLAAVDLHACIPALEAFQCVLIRWPGIPQALIKPITADLPHQRVEGLERLAVNFYLEQFYMHSSHPAIVPHRFPFPS